MAEYVSEARLRAMGASVEVNFSVQIHEALTIAELTAMFREAAGLYGACWHRCTALGAGEKSFLFGDDTLPPPPATAPAEALIFPITGWDERDYEVEIALLAGPAPPERRASLHLMACLYLARGLALVEARDDLDAGELTAVERYCFDERGQGRCNLDIAEQLDRSVHAVSVHFQRANHKLGG